jgi:peptidyl-tRNA hydrolase, PTH1 family
MKLIVGLGNPGKKYEHTRHNVGWDTMRRFADAHQALFQTKPDFKAEIAEIRLNNEKVLLALPHTFMNLSGEAVQTIAHYYKIPIEQILIVQDEMDYDVGRMALVAQAGPAGHNGIVSIQEALGTDKIARLRIGIGRPQAPIAKEDYVLQPFAKEEQETIDKVIGQAVEATKDWIMHSTEHTMNAWNGK